MRPTSAETLQAVAEVLGGELAQAVPSGPVRTQLRAAAAIVARIAQSLDDELDVLWDDCFDMIDSLAQVGRSPAAPSGEPNALGGHRTRLEAAFGHGELTALHEELQGLVVVAGAELHASGRDKELRELHRRMTDRAARVRPPSLSLKGPSSAR